MTTDPLHSNPDGSSPTAERLDMWDRAVVEQARPAAPTLRERIQQSAARLQPQPAIRVMVVDASEIVRVGEATMLAAFPDVTVVAVASDGLSAVALCQEVRPDVVLMDLRLPRLHGIEAARCMRAACPATQVIAVTTSEDPTLIAEMLKAGAIGYLTKEVSGVELVEAIYRATRGEPSLSTAAGEVLVKLSTGQSLFPFSAALTHREREVLVLLVQGLHNRDIAQGLNVSVQTIKNHVQSILSKFGVSTRSHVVALAVEYRLLE